MGEKPVSHQNLPLDKATDPREEVGVAVNCAVCGMRKKPIGRSAPLEMANGLCDFECPGYRQDPQPGFLWPGEKRSDLGY